MKIRRVLATLAALAIVGWMPHDSTAPQRYALIVGITDYANFGSEIGGDLPGAAWDARRMRDVLIARWGFDADRIHLVLDTDATRDRIEHELTDWLPSVTKEGDMVLFFFAGHGSQAWDLVGDEEDGLDETICPTDVLKGDASRDIRDDELNEWLSALPAEVVVILDNCHAGTGTRAVTPFARPRSLARTTADIPQPARAGGAGMTAEAPSPRNVLEIAAAQAGEVAVDAEWPGVGGAPSTYGGAFTTTFVRHLWRVPRRTSYEDVFHLTAEDMKQQRFAQQPLLTRNGVERTVFAHADATDATVSEEATVPVTRVDGSAVELGGGTGAGITEGSIYRAGDAILRVTAVAGSGASARVASGRAPRAGQSATLAAYAFPTEPLRVSLADVDDSSRDAIRGAAGSAAVLFTTTPREFAHLIVRPAEQGYVILGMDGATRHRLTASDRAANLRRIGEELQKEAGAHQLAALDNPGQGAALDFGFRSGGTAFRVGDDIGFRVVAPRDGYLTIVDLGTDGRIVVLYPNEAGQDNRVRSGQLFELPRGGLAFEAQEPVGRGIVRAFLTDRPMNLRFSGDTPEQAATILDALRSAAGAAPVSGSAAIPTASWLTASVVYTIER